MSKTATQPTGRTQSSQNPQGKKQSEPVSIHSLFSNYQLADKGGFITQEFQDFGYRLAVELNDMAHKSLYIKMAKTVDRGILERALSFVSDAKALSKARLFMWKVADLKKQKPSSVLKKTEIV